MFFQCFLKLFFAAFAASFTALSISGQGPVSQRANAFATGDLRSAEFGQSLSSLDKNTPTNIGFELFLAEPVDTVSNRSTQDASRSFARFGPAQMPEPSLSVDGLSNRDNAELFNLLIIPPDMFGDIGPNHYVQIVNSLFRVYDRNGQPASPRIRLDYLFAPLGTVCSSRFDGLPNVVYDQFADRWLISQVCSAFPPFRQMIAISKTGDPAGEYFLYEFVMPNVKINDFPKFGLWTDAYYMTTDEFLGSDYAGSGIFAFDRKKMLAGDDSASYIYFNLPTDAPIRRRGTLPADIDGLIPPPAAANALFLSYTADEYGDPVDALRLFEFEPDFDEPTNSSFTELAESPLAVTPFDPTSPAGRADIAQPPPGEFLDSQSDRVNYRLAYRNFGTSESLVVNQTVRMTPATETYRAGVKLTELRRSGGSFTPAVEATIGDDSSSRWIGSAAQDNGGNLAVQYNFVSSEKKPSIFYTGRLTGDPPNTLRDEAALIEGTGVQKAFGFRWGEYSGMSVDPADDCTFWLTNSYYSLASQEFSDLGWLTRFGRFKFDECTAAPRAFIQGVVTDAVSGQAIQGATVTLETVSRVTNAQGSFGPAMLLPGQVTISVAASGYRSAGTTVLVSNGETATRNFQLTPVPVATNLNSALGIQGCPLNRSSQPGEELNLRLTLRNDGARSAAELVAELLAGGGIESPGAPQVYGALAIGEMASRTFAFTISNGVECGALVEARFAIRDGVEEVGTLTVPLRVGRDVVPFAENFDLTIAPTLPAGWTTSASENHQIWRTSQNRTQSSPNALFSPAPLQRGVNEVISPSFDVNTGQASLRFRNWYVFETTFLRNRLYDGSVLELSFDGGEWMDILDAGGSFVRGGYDGTLDQCCQNPLGGRQGWSGRSGVNQTSEFIDTVAKLPPSAAGRNVRLRFRVGTDIGSFREGQYIDDLVVTDGYDCSCTRDASNAPYDFDGDGRSDLATYNYSDVEGVADLLILNSGIGSTSEVQFGSAGDDSTVSDYDGDGRADAAVFRPQTGTWYVLRSNDLSVGIFQFGLSADRPVPADFDGDGKADIAVYRPGEGLWFVLRSSDGRVDITRFGLPADVAVAGDYDGDRQADIALFRPADGVWYIRRSSDGGTTFQRFGLAADRPVQADFDGDGTTDIAVYRPAEGVWYLLRSSEGFSAVRFGLAGDIPLAGDFDGDGRADVAVYRPTTSVWYYISSTSGTAVIREFGEVGANPIPVSTAGS